MRKHNILYLTSNRLSGKKYIGSHETDNLNDGYLGSGQYISHSIKKHGRNAFSREILKECATIEEARLLEEKYIKIYNSLYPIGYNISSTGGMGKYGGTHSIHTREKLSKAHKGKKRIFTEAHKKKLSASAKKWHDEIGFSEETKNKIRKNKTGKSPANTENYFIGNSQKNLGKKHSPASIEKMRSKLNGRENTEETKAKIAEGIRKSRIECPNCHKKVPLNVYNRCHGNKCLKHE